MNSYEIIKHVARNLKNININLIEKQFDLIDKIEDKKERYDQLAELCAYKTITHPEW